MQHCSYLGCPLVPWSSGNIEKSNWFNWLIFAVLDVGYQRPHSAGQKKLGAHSWGAHTIEGFTEKCCHEGHHLGQAAADKLQKKAQFISHWIKMAIFRKRPEHARSVRTGGRRPDRLKTEGWRRPGKGQVSHCAPLRGTALRRMGAAHRPGAPHTHINDALASGA